MCKKLRNITECTFWTVGDLDRKSLCGIILSNHIKLTKATLRAHKSFLRDLTINASRYKARQIYRQEPAR
jgi:hypothetical protein